MNVESRIRAVFEGALDDGTPWRHPNAPILIQEVKGRCVHVVLSGSPDWAIVAEYLIGAGGPCDEFRLEGRDLYARLKTDAQRAADDAALDYDETQDRMWTWDLPDFAEKTAKSKPKKDTRGKWERLLEEFIRESGKESFTRLALLEDAREAFKANGHEIRIDNLNRELKKLVGRVLEADGEDEYTVKVDE